MTDQEALVALNLIPDIGSVRLKNLLEASGSAPKIFLNSQDTLKKVPGITERIAKNIASFSFEELKKELDLSKKLKVSIITLGSKDYPENLKNIYDPPLCLYVTGEIFPIDNLSIAIVGSRRASYYGLSCAEKFSYALASFGLTIISGLARGIDTKAHKGALKAMGRTIAVLGSGLNHIYPPENALLFKEVSESGAVVSEFPLNTGPLAHNFPRRNRLISGLSLGVLVVEAARNSGALITSDYALEQNREVFAVPGEVNSITSYGTNQLIKQGAKLVDSAEDVLEELLPLIKNLLPKENEKSFKPRFNETEKLVYDNIGAKPRYVDEIAEGAKIPTSKIMSALLTLEMRKLIKQLPGKMFVRASILGRDTKSSCV